MFGLTFAQELIAGLQLALHRIQAVVSLGQLHLERSDEVVFEIYQAASGTRHKRRRLGFRVDGRKASLSGCERSLIESKASHSRRES